MKRISLMLVFALLISVCASLTAFAADEKRFDTKQGGYVTVSNVVDEKHFEDEGAGIGDTIYVANAPVVVTIHGNQYGASVLSLPEGKLVKSSFDMGTPGERVELKDNITLSKPGYYGVRAMFGEDNPDNIAAFVIQIVGDSPATDKPETVSAVPTASKVLINGKEVSFEAYNINGNNYFKLRDLAMALNGTTKNFEVGFDNTKNAINLISKKVYTPAGGELVVSEKPMSKEAKPTSSKIYLDGKEIQLTAYNIGGSNYFKLRDIAKAINFGVTWDGKASMIGIDTKSDYKEEVAESQK